MALDANLNLSIRGFEHDKIAVRSVVFSPSR